MTRRKAGSAPVAPGLIPQPGATRLKGVQLAYFDTMRQKWITRSWPKAAKTRTMAQQQNNRAFKQAQWLIKNSTGEDLIASYKMADGTTFLARDVRMKAAYGVLFEVHFKDGTVWTSKRLAMNNIQQLLNSITDIPGSMLVRTPDGWQGLSPPSGEQLLGFNPIDGVPEWVTFTDDAQTILNQLTPDSGAIVYFDGAAWQALAPGLPGQQLTVDPLGDGLLWVTPSAPTQGYPAGTPPTVIQVAHGTSAVSASFAAAPTAGNLIVAMTWNSANNAVTSGWAKQLENSIGTDWGNVCTKVAGAGEPTLQQAMSTSTANGGVVLYELAKVGGTPAFVIGLSQDGASSPLVKPLILPNVKDMLGIGGLGLSGGVTYTQGFNVGTSDVFDNTGNRKLISGHSDLSILPGLAPMALISGSGQCKPVLALFG